MLFWATTFLQNLQQKLEAALFHSEVSCDVITILYETFCNFFHGCEKVEAQHVQSLAHCCLQYIHCIQNYIDNTPGRIHVDAVKEYVSIVAEISKLGNVKDSYLLCITIPIFEKITEPDIKTWFAKELLRNFNLAVQGTQKDLRHSIVARNSLHLCKLADLICTCGDYDYQVTLLEAIFRMCSELQISMYAHELFPTSTEFERGFCNISKDHFDRDVRTFLTMVNAKLKKVLSLKCELIQLGTIKVAAPKYSDEDESPIWTDFNLGTRTITILCDKDSLRSGSLLDSSNSGDFELIAIDVVSISDVVISRIMDPNSAYSRGLVILFNMAAPCSVLFASSEAAKEASQLKLAIYASSELTELIRNILPTWFRDNLTFLTPTIPIQASKWNQRSKNTQKLALTARDTARVYKPLDVVSSAPMIEESNESSISIVSSCVSQEEQENSKLKQKSTVTPKMQISERRVYKPLVTDDVANQSRARSLLSSKSSTSDALSLKGKLLAHETTHFIKTGKDHVSKSPKIRNVEQLREMVADLKFASRAEEQSKNRIPSKTEKAVTESESTERVDDRSDNTLFVQNDNADRFDDILFVENENIQQNYFTNVNTRVSVAQTKEIIKVKWRWPKKVALGIPAPESSKMSVTANSCAYNEEHSNSICKTTESVNFNNKNSDDQKQLHEECSFAEKQLANSEDQVISFLSTSGNDKFTKEETSLSKSKVKIPKRQKRSATKRKKIVAKKQSLPSNYRSKPKDVDTTANTESIHTEQPSTLNVLISGDICDREPVKNIKVSLSDSSTFTRHIGKLVEGNEGYKATNSVELETDNSKLKYSDIIEEIELQSGGSSIITADCEKRVHKENNDVPVPDMTSCENKKLDNTGQVLEKILHKESENVYLHSKLVSSEDTEKRSSSGIVESSQSKEDSQFYKIDLKNLKKRGRPAKRNSKTTGSGTGKTTNSKTKMHLSIASSIKSSSNNYISSHQGEIFEEHHEKKKSFDEYRKPCYVVIESLNIVQSLKQNENEIKKTLTKESVNQTKTNETEELPDKEIHEGEKVSTPEENTETYLKRQADVEAAFDSLLEEYKTSQGNYNPKETNNEELLETNPCSEALLSESNESENQNQMEYVGKSSNFEKKMQGHGEVLDAASAMEITQLSNISQSKRKKDKLEEIAVKRVEHDKIVKPNSRKETTDEYLSMNDAAEQMRKETSSEEFFQAPQFARTTKNKRKRQTKISKGIKKLPATANVSKSVQKKTAEENHARASDDIEIIQEETSSQEFLEYLKLSNKSKIPKCKKQPSQKIEGLSNEESSSKRDKHVETDILDKDHFNTPDMVEKIPEETSSQEFMEEIASRKIQNILQRNQSQKVKTQYKTSQKYASPRVARKSGRISKRIDKHDDLNLQNFNEQLQDSFLEVGISAIEATESKANAPKTNKVEALIPNESEQNLNIHQQKDLSLADKEIQGKQIPVVANKAAAETKEDHLQNTMLFNNEIQKLQDMPDIPIEEQLLNEEIQQNDSSIPKTTQETQDEEMTTGLKENEQFQTTIDNDQQETTEKLCVKQKGPLDKQLEKNNIRILGVVAQPKSPITEQTEDPVPNSLHNSNQQPRLSSSVGSLIEKQLPDNELEKINIIPTQPQIASMETNENQSLQQKTETHQLSSVLSKSNDKQLQDRKLEYNLMEVGQSTLVETAESVTTFDQLLLESINSSSNRKQNISGDKQYIETPKKRIGEFLAPNQVEETNKKNATTKGIDAGKMKKIQPKSRKLYDIDDTSYFGDHGEVVVREKSTKSARVLAESLNKKWHQTTNVIVEERSVAPNKTPARRNSVNENRSPIKIQTDLGKLEKSIRATNRDQHDNKVRFDSKAANKTQSNDINKLENNADKNRSEKVVLQNLNETPQRRLNKRSRKDEKGGDYKKQRKSLEPEQPTRSNAFESIIYTGAHLNSPKQLERRSQFDLFMQSFDLTLKQYTTVISNPKRQRSCSNSGNKRKTNEGKYKNLKSVEKQMSRSKQIKQKENISRYYKKLVSQLSSSLSELTVEKEIMEVSVVELSDDEDELDQRLQSNSEPKVSSKASKKNQDDVFELQNRNSVKKNTLPMATNKNQDGVFISQNRTRVKKNTLPLATNNEDVNECSLNDVPVLQNHNDVKKNTPPLATNIEAVDEYYPVSPLNSPAKSVQASSNITSWVEGATVIHEIRLMRGQISNIERVLLNLQKIFLDKVNAKVVN